MKFRGLAFLGAMAVAMSMALVEIAAQTPTYTAPRTVWGDPDLQGIWRALDIMTPMERPLRFGDKAEYTKEEIAKKQKEMEDAMKIRCAGGMVMRGYRAQPNYNALYGCSDDDMSKLVPHRTSAIIDPPNGRLPPWTLEQVKLWEEREKVTEGHGETDTVLDMDDGGRCFHLLGGGGMGGTNKPLSPEERARRQAIIDSQKVVDGGEGFRDDGSTGGPGNNEAGAIRIMQSKGYVAWTHEEGGTYTLVPTDGRPPLSPKMRQYMGDPRGRWEGNTLVVEYNGRRPKGDPFGRKDTLIIPNFGIGYIGAGETLHVTQRYTRIGPDTLQVKVTVEDPAVWTRPFTWVREMTRDDGFKFTQQVCQENTKDLGNSLAHARADEQLSLEYGDTAREDRVKLFEERKAEAIAEAEKNKKR